MSLRRNHISKYSDLVVGITMGDPSGIGPEVISKAIGRLERLAKIVVIGDKHVLSSVGYKPLKAETIDLNNICRRDFRFGRIKSKYGRASIEYIDLAMKLIKSGRLDCLVTCPVSKEAVCMSGVKNFSGHTEYIAAALGIKNTVMMLLNDSMKFSLATRHIPLKKVSSKLNQGLLYSTALISYNSLKELFLIKDPKIVFCGLNPHASDNGLIGDEENKIIKPAVGRLKKIIRNISGPVPADTAIARMQEKIYDCVIASYHDQALIPLKLYGYSKGVNLTLGLPLVRTSPLHGTAFDIAGQNKACPGSLMEATRVAVKCTLNLRKA